MRKKKMIVIEHRGLIDCWDLLFLTMIILRAFDKISWSWEGIVVLWVVAGILVGITNAIDNKRNGYGKEEE